MTTHTTTQTAIELAAQRLYDAEVALHAAHSSQVDAWIAAAADRLHDAITAHLAAVATQHATR
jgi:hypothetical protein